MLIVHLPKKLMAWREINWPVCCIGMDYFYCFENIVHSIQCCIDSVAVVCLQAGSELTEHC